MLSTFVGKLTRNIYILGVYSLPKERNIVYIPITTSSRAALMTPELDGCLDISA